MAREDSSHTICKYECNVPGKIVWMSLCSAARQCSFFSRSSFCCSQAWNRSRICWLNCGQKNNKYYTVKYSLLQTLPLTCVYQIKVMSLRQPAFLAFICVFTLSLTDDGWKALWWDPSLKDGTQPSVLEAADEHVGTLEQELHISLLDTGPVAGWGVKLAFLAGWLWGPGDPKRCLFRSFWLWLSLLLLAQ